MLYETEHFFFWITEINLIYKAPIHLISCLKPFYIVRQRPWNIRKNPQQSHDSHISQSRWPEDIMPLIKTHVRARLCESWSFLCYFLVFKTCFVYWIFFFWHQRHFFLKKKKKVVRNARKINRFLSDNWNSLLLLKPVLLPTRCDAAAGAEQLSKSWSYMIHFGFLWTYSNCPFSLY